MNIDTDISNERKQKRNQRRKEKRKKDKEKKKSRLDIVSARNRIDHLKESIIKENKLIHKKDSSYVSNLLINLLLAIQLDSNQSLPECSAFYYLELSNDNLELSNDIVLEKSQEKSDDDGKNVLYFKNDILYLCLKSGKNTRIKNSSFKKDIYYSFDTNALNFWTNERTWIKPELIWSDTQSFGRGMKRKINRLMGFSEDKGYTLVSFMKDLELIKKGKSSINGKIWEEDNVDLNLDEAFEKFRDDVKIDTDGFISYDELSNYRNEKYKLKFNILISEFYSEHVIRGHRHKNKRGFKGISFIKKGT